MRNPLNASRLHPHPPGAVLIAAGRAYEFRPARSGGAVEGDAFLFVYADAQTLQWRAEAPLRLDVTEFEAALARAAAAEQQAHAPALQAALEQAVGVYGGDLLPSGYAGPVAGALHLERGAVWAAEDSRGRLIPV